MIEIRRLRSDELPDAIKVDERIWGLEPGTGPSISGLEPDRALIATDGTAILGLSDVLSLRLSVPGSQAIDLAGITWLAVDQRYRRQGIMRRLLTHQLELLADGGEPIAGLWASESHLYRRFGFGAAAFTSHFEIDTRHAGFRASADPPGQLMFADAEVGLGHLRTIRSRVASARNGVLDARTFDFATANHNFLLRDAGVGPVVFLIHVLGDIVDGIVAYRIEARHDEREVTSHRLHVVDLFAFDEQIAAALWKFCLGHDLVSTVVARRRPVDDVLLEFLADPRRAHIVTVDELHLRPIDTAKALAARRYARQDHLVLKVEDDLLESARGTFVLEGGLEGGSCERATSQPDLTITAAGLGSLYLGDGMPWALQATGDIIEHTTGALRRLASMFCWSPRPWPTGSF